MRVSEYPLLNCRKAIDKRTTWSECNSHALLETGYRITKRTCRRALRLVVLCPAISCFDNGKNDQSGGNH